MRLLKLIPDNTNIGFVRLRYWAFGLTALLSIAAAGIGLWTTLRVSVLPARRSLARTRS